MKNIYALIIVPIVCLWVSPVMAYIDPGSGSAIMSAIIGIFVAIGITIKTYWYKLKSIFSGNKRNVDIDEPNKLEK